MSKDKQLEEVAADTLSRLSDGVATIADKLGTAVETHGQAAVDVVLWAARAAALQSIVFGIVGLLLSIVTWKVARAAIKKSNTVNDGDAEGFFVFVSVVMGFLCIFGSYMTLTHLFDAYAWISIFAPEVWLARSVVGL